MARLNALGSPGVYAISFKDTEYNPQTKIVEGTTGQKYASDYMGARSRWWDISMKQALYETGQIDAYNKAIDAEIKAIGDTIGRMQQDKAKAADVMARHNDTIQNQRDRFNASVDPVITRAFGSGTRAGRGGAGATAREGRARNYKISTAVQEGLTGVKSPQGVAAAFEGLTRAGKLGEDEYSQNMGAYYAIQQEIEGKVNELTGQGLDIAEARAQAESDVLETFGAFPKGRALTTRYQDVVSRSAQEAGTGGAYDFTRTTIRTSGKVPLGERKPLEPTDVTPQIAALRAQQAALRGMRKPGLDIIERTRQIQREKFGPSITQALRELPGEIRRLRQPEGLGRELRAIRRFLEAGGTMEELQGLIAPPTPVGPPVERDVTVRGVRPGVGEVPGRFAPPGRFLEADRFPPPVPVIPEDELSVEPGVAPPREGYFSTPEMRRRAEIEAEAQRMIPAPLPNIGQPRMMSTAPAPRGMGLELGTRPGPGRPMTDEEIEAARRSILPRQEFFPGVPMGSEEQFRREEIEAAMPQITPPSVPSGVPGMIETVSPRREAGAEEPGLRSEPGKEKPKQRKTKLFGVDAGSPEQVQHRGNLLQGFTAAAGLLEKPKALDRKTANAPAGSPQQFARAIIDAERSKSPTERRPLKDLVANVAQQYNQMGDKKGRDAALENTIALYKLFLDETSLLG